MAFGVGQPDRPAPCARIPKSSALGRLRPTYSGRNRLDSSHSRLAAYATLCRYYWLPSGLTTSYGFLSSFGREWLSFALRVREPLPRREGGEANPALCIRHLALRL